MIKHQAHKLLESFQRATDEIRQLPASHILLNSTTCGCVGSGFAYCALASVAKGPLSPVLQELVISSVIVCGMVRGLGEVRKAREAYLTRMFMQSADLPEKPNASRAVENPKSHSVLNIPTYQFRKPRESFLKKMDRGIGYIVQFTPDHAQFVAQAIMQAPVVVVTAFMVFDGSDPNTNLGATLFAFALNFTGNIVSFVQSAKAKKTLGYCLHDILPANASPQSAKAIGKRLVQNANFFWAAAFMVAGGTLVPDLTALLADVIFAAAVGHTVLAVLPRTYHAIYNRLSTSPSKLMKEAARFIDDQNQSLILFAAGCVVTFSYIATHTVPHPREHMEAMALWSLSCLSIYALERWGGVAELVDALMEKNAAKRPPAQKLVRQHPLVLERL